MSPDLRGGPAVDLRVETVRTPCPGVRSITLARDDDGRLPSFPPGAHVAVEWAPGHRTPYSLTGPLRDPDRWHLSVAGRPGGTGGAGRMHALRPWDRLRVGGPHSRFTPVATAAHHVLVAAGIGVTPILSHARRHAAWGASFTVLYVHRPGVAPHLHDLRELCGDRLRTATGRDEVATLLASALDGAPFNSHVYTCGPPGLIARVAGAARARHWVGARIHAEPFTAAARPGRPFPVVLRRSGIRIGVGADESVLDALDRAGVAAPRLCRQGVCGECVTPVAAGSVEHRDAVLSPVERAAGLMALCVSRGDGLELDL